MIWVFFFFSRQNITMGGIPLPEHRQRYFCVAPDRRLKTSTTTKTTESITLAHRPLQLSIGVGHVSMQRRTGSFKSCVPLPMRSRHSGESLATVKFKQLVKVNPLDWYITRQRPRRLLSAIACKCSKLCWQTIVQWDSAFSNITGRIRDFFE